MKSSRWHSCNVLQLAAGGRRYWQFSSGNGQVVLTAGQATPTAAPLPPKLAAKDWQALWRRKLNIAWLPPEQVFLRVIQLPGSDPSELRSMVELQLEKLSPLPLNQIIWTFELLPHSSGGMQTVIVIIVERSLVETYLERLEQEGYLTDRLEFPLLHQLLDQQPGADGTWIYLSSEGSKIWCLSAWWFGDSLQSLHFLALPHTEEGAKLLWDQLMQIAWAGEVEGWLRAPFRWHMVAAPEISLAWEPLLSGWAGEKVETSEPPGAGELAALSAQRATRGATKANLVPPEFSARYQQQFIDRLWIGGLVALAGVYLVGVVIYLGAVQFLKYQEHQLEQELASLSPSYTNAMVLKERLQVLEEQVNLKFAALDCWKAAAEVLPSELTLTTFSFQRGKNLHLQGTVPSDQGPKVIEYNSALKKIAVNDQPLFKRVEPPNINQGRWSFNCELEREEME